MEEIIDGHLLSDPSIMARMADNMFKLKIDPRLVVFGVYCKPLS